MTAAPYQAPVRGLLSGPRGPLRLRTWAGGRGDKLRYVGLSLSGAVAGKCVAALGTAKKRARITSQMKRDGLSSYPSLPPSRTPLRTTVLSREREGKHNSEALASPALIALLLLHLLQFLSLLSRLS